MAISPHEKVKLFSPRTEQSGIFFHDVPPPKLTNESELNRAVPPAAFTETHEKNIVSRSAGIFKKIFEVGMVIVLSVGLVVGFAEAGNLAPSASPAATMQTLQTIYDTIAGSFDSSGVAASSSGLRSALRKLVQGTRKKF